MVGSKEAGVFLRDVVGDFVESHADGELAAIFAIGNPVALLASAELRETRGFISITTMRPVGGVDGELNVRSAGFDADFANDRRRGVAHALIFLVGQRLRRRDGDRIARVDAHGVEIFDRADHHEVVAEIAHHFEFVFFPAEDGFFDERFVHGARVESACEIASPNSSRL